ncbi:MAG: Ig-like domain-containing protein [Verrucomicrobiota bacterium]|nr:Ig-like domain-containing protein [Verrucomicrobiota bacterium]
MTRISLAHDGAEAEGGPSDQPQISGDGQKVTFRSEATNLITGKGISFIEVISGGVGYLGNPTISVNDSGGTGTGAQLRFFTGGVDIYGQITPTGIEIFDHGQNYDDPFVTIVPDPAFPAPSQVASVRAHITHPQGEVYAVDLNVGVNDPNRLRRISENSFGVGGNFPSRDAFPSDNGEKIVFSTKASNLQADRITRADGKTFYNYPVSQAVANVIVLGGIGEIEVDSPGSGYQNGFLTIDDLGGTGNGAVASYQVDSFGRISSVNIVTTGSDYNLDTTVISVQDPRGGTGFQAGDIRFSQEFGRDDLRQGGGRVHRVEMVEHGRGYKDAASTTQGLEGLITIDGDGVDVDLNGLPDAKVNPDLIHIDALGGIYLEQSYVVEVVSSASLLTTLVTFEDANQSITIDFAPSDSPPLTVGILGKTTNQIRNAIITIIEDQWSDPINVMEGPQIEDNLFGGNQFTFKALSGRVTLNDFSSIQASVQSNMLFSGTGFTRATAVIAPGPTIHGFSEILSTSSGGNVLSNGRNLYLDQQDDQSDDIYLYDWNHSHNERVSRSTFGFPVNYRSSQTTTMPSNRFPEISGNGRYVFFSSDSSEGGGLVFNGSNQTPLDTDSTRDIFIHDTKSLVLTSSQNEIATQISMVGVAPLKFKFGEIARINLKVNTDDDGHAERVYLFNGPQMINPNNSPTNYIQYNVNNPLHQAGFFPFEFNATFAGQHDFRAMVIDSFGSQRFQDDDFKVEIVKLASLAPTVEMINWTESNAYSITSTSKLLLSATASDSDGAIGGLQFFVNGQPYGNILSYDSNYSQANYPYSMEWSPESDFNSTSNDHFLIYAKISDTSGNEVMSEPVLYRVTAGGKNIPILKMESLNNSYAGGKTIFLSVNEISDLNENNDTGIIEELSFIVNGVVRETQTNAPYFFPYTPNEDGLYEVYAIAKDNEGNYGISNRQTFQVNNTVTGIDTPVLGSTFPNVTGETLSFTEERRLGRRSTGVSEKKDYTVIKGFNTLFLNQLAKDQIVRFSVSDSITEKTYTVSEITSDKELVLEGNMTDADKSLLGSNAQIQIVQSYRVGSMIPMFLKDDVDDVDFQSVEFYADGELQGRDQTWPFSSVFIPQSEGNYTLGVVANTTYGGRSLYTERIYVEPKIGGVPDGTISLFPELTRNGSTTIGSQMMVSANYEDLDESGMNRVEFYLNGKLMHVDREEPYYFKFKPETDASILFVDRFWEVTAVGIDNEGNRIALTDNGSVQGGLILPTAEIQSPLNAEEFSDGQSMQVSIDVEGTNIDRLLGQSSNIQNPNTTLSPRMMNVHANGVFILTAIETAWGTGSFTGEWVCDKNLAGESGFVELVASIVMTDENIDGLSFTPVVVSEAVQIKVVEPNLVGSPKAAINQTFVDLLAYSPSEQEVNLSFSDQMMDGQYLFDNQDYLDWVVGLTTRDTFQNTVDAISGYHTMTGQWPDYSKIQEILSSYSAVPNNGSDGTLDQDGDGFSSRQEIVFRTSDSDPTDFPSSAFNVGAFIDDTLSSREYTNIHGPVPVLTPPQSGPDRFTNYDKNRRDFVRKIFSNKYGRLPTLQQEIQGSYRISVFDPNSEEARMDQQRQMMQQIAMFSNFGVGGLGGGGGRGGGGNNLNQFLPLLGGGNNNQNQQTQPTYQSGQPAVLFVSNMIAEEQIDNLDMIWGAEQMRETYEVAALISSFWQDNLELLSDDLILQFNGMTTEEVISSLMKDSRYFSRFGGYSITRYGTELANAPGWKWLEWLGHFNEEKFPWIYHTGLGWMYVHGLTDDQTWFYIPSAGWLGTTKEIWEVMDETSNYLWLYEQSNSRWVAYYLQQPAGKIFWNPQSKSYFTYE